ncbi:hypothetical protein Nepgr_032046 [Nepenthes gracilis]|uniref:Sister chromatid cohesion protein n=1 Tax=Nepenthes gracilis TaxID=150966 RepID=A0AAD3TJR1_NEPGR|nr:hypothetical protein Nepgr_032046 [Nepenthes gracilis]
MSNTPGDWGSHRGISLANTAHSEVAPCLPLPSLPSFCGAADQELWFFDDQPSRPLNRSDILAQASKIADLLQETDVSYLNLKHDLIRPAYGSIQPSALYDEVLRYNPDAFQDACRGPVEEQIYSTVFNRQTFQHNVPLHNQVQRDFGESHSYPHDRVLVDDIPSSSRKSQVKKKGSREISSTLPDPIKHQDAVLERFSEVLEDFLTGAEIPSEDQDDAEWLPLPNSDIRMLVNEVLSIWHEKMLHLVPVDKLARLLKVLDHQIHRAEGLSIDECEQSDSDVSSIFSALESIHAVLAVMTHNDMPKHLYKEEIIERILEFIRRQIMDVMSASDSSYRALHGPSENRVDGEEDEEADANYGSSSKKRRIYRSVKAKRTGNNRVSASVNAVLQKLCTILGFLKDLLLIERLPDSCILQLVKTSLSTLLVDNIQLLQLKAISLISGIFYSYAEHRTHIVDEVVLLLWKLPFSKRAIRAYHLQDEEQKQIQMVTALLLQLVHHSTNLPEALRQSLSCSTVLETTVDSSYLIKCHEAATETCVSFWTRILQRFTSVKSQDASELKSIMENLILDLLTTFNMPEYPASALILEVLSVLLLQNAGPKSKDTSVRSTAIEILGTIAARLKHDSALCGLDDFWIVQELACRENVDESHEKDTCSVCMDGKTEKFLAACQGCQKLFHADCMGVRELDISTHSWHCPICLSRKQLLVLQSYCKSQSVNKGKNNQSRLEQSSEAGDSISKVEIVQQILLNYLQDAGSADDHLFARWFYLCLWYKDDPKSRHKFSYRLASLNSKSIVRDSGVSSSMLARDSIKKITSALGQKSSFSRGFDTILCMLLVSLRENSPVIRAKTLRAVSMIVEADPDVLCDKRVQSAVEGRFCDSAISVREAALELVGRYIASHPDVGLKYFEKVAERVKDTGVSVRKRAIKIIREMCISNVNFIEYPRACIDIISRVTDEESSIQDLVCKTFFEFWFEEPSDAPTQFFGDSSSVPLEVAKKTEQIVDMLKKMPNHQPLVTVIKRNLALDFVPQSAKAAGINPVSLATVHKRCELMCKYLLERILQVEEMDKEEGKVRTLPYVMLLHAFCIVDPTLCAPASDPSQFVVTLQPYLKNQVDNRLVAQLLESIIFVIDAVLPFIRRLPSSVVEELEQDLKQMIVRHSFLTVVHACIKCLCTVSKIVGKRGTLIEFLIQVFFKHLDALGLDNKQLVGRSLFCLGLLIRYGHSFLSDSSRYIDVISSLSLFKKYLLVDDFVIKARALQALGFVLIARPECMLEKDVANILAATLSSACDARLKLQSLQNMYEYLLDAESKMETDKVEENEVDCSVKGGSSVPVAAGAGDTNICGGIVQLYWDNILERSLDINEQVRQLGLKIVEVVLRQGLVHPITCVPYLVALETDHLESNSKLAHHLLMNMNEKYPSFFESRLGDGLQLSFIFMQSINAASENLNMKHQHTLLGNVKGKSDDSSFANARLGVSRIYKLIRGNRVARNKFMSSVVRKFDNPRWSDTVIPFLKYCTDILALLPFTSPDEPLYLIYVINRVIQVRSGTLEANLKALSLHFSQQGSQKMVHENGIAQQELITDPVSAPTMLLEVNGTIQQEPRGQHLPIQSTSMDANMHSANFGDSHVINEDDLQKIQDVSIAATALQLLLKLKRHLKIVYSLDNVRCQAFSPTDPPKPGEVLSKQSVPLNIHGIHDDLPSTSQELTQRYQDLKNALKEDTMDYSAYTANIKRKRPPSRRGGRSARLTGRDVEDDADDDDDEEWTDGMRRPNRSGRQGSSFRGTRLRS